MKIKQVNINQIIFDFLIVFEKEIRIRKCFGIYGKAPQKAHKYAQLLFPHWILQLKPALATCIIIALCLTLLESYIS